MIFKVGMLIIFHLISGTAVQGRIVDILDDWVVVQGPLYYETDSIGQTVALENQGKRAIQIKNIESFIILEEV